MKLLSKVKEVKEGIVLAAAIGFLLCVYAPIELFLSGQDEFWFTIETIATVCIAMFGAVFLFLTVGLIILRLIHKTAYNIGLLVGLSGLLICYVQGNFFASGLPPMDGTNIDWNSQPVERIKSIVLCVVVFAALLFTMIKFRAVFKKVALFCPIALGLVLAITLTSFAFTTPIVEKKGDLVATGYNDFVYSKDKNLVVLVVDATDSTRFLEALDANSEFDDTFDDFTYYDDALAMYPYTLNALPSMLSGVWNENEVPYREYVESAFDKSPLLNYLRNENYKIGLYNKGEIVLSQKYNGVFENQVNAKLSFSSPLAAGVAVVKMAAIRYAPWDLKFYGYNLTDHLEDSRVATVHDAVKKNNRIFYKTITESNPVTVVEEKCARILHIEGSHVPLRYNKNVEIIEDGTYMDNVECSITICKAFLDRLKENGVYDNSVIVILGDHGFDDLKSRGLKARANPVLLVKGINDKGNEMKMDSTPISYESLAESFTNLLKEEETTDTVFDKYSYPEGRRFIKYGYLSEDHMTEYIFKGRADELDKVFASGKVFDLVD